MLDTSTLDEVREYYCNELQASNEFRTSTCYASKLPAHIHEILLELDAEILAKFYGCAAPIPPAVEGLTVLDLGCGSGRDAFICSKLVGPRGRVIGVDVNAELLAIARKHAAEQAQTFGFATPNTDFRLGFIEDLAALDIADESVDVVISNCVINLSPDKSRVFREIFRVLKPGGELYFADVFADRRVPEDLRRDPVLRGECLGGAMYIEDFRRLLSAVGCHDYRVVTRSPVDVDDRVLERKIGMIEFAALTVRAFKLPLEDRCEDYGQVAVYRGGLPEAPHRFVFDSQYAFLAGKPLPICGNVAEMLAQSRFREWFDVIGDRSTHFGRFESDSSSSGARGVW